MHTCSKIFTLNPLKTQKCNVQYFFIMIYSYTFHQLTNKHFESLIKMYMLAILNAVPSRECSK